MYRIVDSGGEGEDWWQGVDQRGTDVACELVSAAEEHRALRAQVRLVGGVVAAELVVGNAGRSGFVSDEVVRSAAHQREVS